MNFDMSATGGWPIVVVISWMLLVVIVHILFALGVNRDVKTRESQLVGGGVWAAATLIGGAFVATAYWIVHSSTLSRSAATPPEEDV